MSVKSSPGPNGGMLYLSCAIEEVYAVSFRFRNAVEVCEDFKISLIPNQREGQRSFILWSFPICVTIRISLMTFINSPPVFDNFENLLASNAFVELFAAI